MWGSAFGWPCAKCGERIANSIAHAPHCPGDRSETEKLVKARLQPFFDGLREHLNRRTT